MLKPRFVMTGLAILFAGMSWAASRGNQESPVSRIFAANVGSKTVEIPVEKSRDGSSEAETLRLAPGEMAEIRRAAGEEVRVPGHQDLLMVTAPTELDPAAVRFGVRPGRTQGGLPGPFATSEKAAAPTRLSPGDSATFQALWAGIGSLPVRLSLHGEASAEVRAMRPDGSILGYVTLSASRDLEVTVDLRSFLEASGYGGLVREEVLVRRGQVSTSMARTAGLSGTGGRQDFVEAVTVGSGVFSGNINFTVTPSPALYYTVTGGPASTCGELNTYRNNSWLFGPNWLCTNASGYAQKGPWTSAPSDQTDNPSFIRWPDGSSTTNDWHIWDTTCPVVAVTSTPPGAWSGTATDGVLGACFRSGYAGLSSKFLNVTTNQYWDSTYGYTWPVEKYWGGILHGMPTCNTTWAQSFPYTLPPASAHVVGNRYRWTVCISDGGCINCKTVEFVY
jgi:hypothetical protein